MLKSVHIMKISVLTAAVVAFMAPAVVAQTVLYVDADALGANIGSSWVHAFTDLQDALAVASTNGAIDEIRVAEGTYTPDRGTGDIFTAFQLIDDVAIMGGYAGYGELDPNARDIADYETVLSGDLNGNDYPPFAGNADNSCHVVIGSGTHATAMLDGFTITGGNAPHLGGGGMYNVAGSPTLTCCKFIGNFSGWHGGGMYNEGSNPTLVNCEFSGNMAEYSGGGMYNYYSNPTITNCTFTGNVTDYYGFGGGICNEHADPVLTNCVLWGNDGYWYLSLEEIQIYARNGSPNVNYCCIEGWSGDWGGVGNFGDDPLFVDADGLDDYAGTLDDDLHLAFGSPCINSGDDNAPSLTAYDFDGEARVQHCRVDIGADETNLFLYDCNGNTVADACDIDVGTSEDCDNNSIPDDCESDEDCNTNAIQDICDLAVGTDHDWNNNGIPDACDIAAGISYDDDGDGVPDEAVLFVDADAVGTHNGSSWEDAYTSLASAISAGCGSTVISQVRVAAGTYKPATDTDREASFQLCNGLAIIGGYAGVGEPDPNARDFELYETILSGDLYDNDQGAANRGDNSYRVVSNMWLDYYPDNYSGVYTFLNDSAVLDGFTISGGNMTAPSYDHNFTYWQFGGGGMYLMYGSPTIRNCTFLDNTAEWDGGGLCNYYGQPTLLNCVFIENHAAHDGGGICNHGGHVTLIDSVFVGNSADNDGGAVFTDDYWNEAGTTMIGCAFFENTADPAYGFGGGVRSGGDTTAVNCVFGGNSAYGGGGMYNSWGSVHLVNGTFFGNVAVDEGAGFFSYGLSSAATLTNCILWNNEAGEGIADESSQLAASSGQLTATYCCIQGLDDFADNGTGNIGDAPRFLDSNGPDGVSGTEDDDLRLLAGSPCIDAGDNAAVLTESVDLDGNPRIVDGDGDADPIVDMGAYEFQGSALPQSVIFVDADADGMNNGTTWTNAYIDLQDALAEAAGTNGLIAEIWVAQGTYRPTCMPDPCAGTNGLRTVSFELIDGVGIYGGFVGTETSRDERDWEARPTILSGDLAGNDIPTNGPDFANNDENSYHVVTSGKDVTTNAILDGFTITSGNADGISSSHDRGGGMYNSNGSPTVMNCTFSGNSAYWLGGGMKNFHSSPTVTSCTFSGNSTGGGGGMANWSHSSPTVTNCTFSGNSAGWGGGMDNFGYGSPTVTNCTFTGNSVYDGGGMANGRRSSTTVINCTFTGNSANNGGGGMYNWDCSDPTVINCTFRENSADDGGGMLNRWFGCCPTVTNCTFSGNSAKNNGGGMSNDGIWSTTVTNCTFSGNSADYGGGMHNYVGNQMVTNCTFSGNSADYGGGMRNCFGNQTMMGCTFSGNSADYGDGMYNHKSSLTVTNCILWDGGDEVWNENGSIITITHSAVEGGWPGEGNIDDDPLFLDPNGPDGVSGTEDDNLRLRAGSPCIDAGSNGAVPYDIADLDDDGDTSERTPLDLAGNLRFVDDPDTDDTGVPDAPDYPYIVDMGAFEYPAAGAQLAASAPANEVSLCRTANNFIRLIFDANIMTPADEELLIEVMNSNGAFGTSYTIATDTSADFAVEVVNDGNGDPRILDIWENGSVLTHTDWIAVYNAGGWTDVAEFYLHYPVMKGDVNGDGDVLPTDFGPMFPKIPTFGSDPDERADVNGDRDVLPTDFGPMFPQIPTLVADYPKPAGH